MLLWDIIIDLQLSVVYVLYIWRELNKNSFTVTITIKDKCLFTRNFIELFPGSHTKKPVYLSIEM